MKIYVIQEDRGDYQYDDNVMDEHWVSNKSPLIAFTTREVAEKYLINNKKNYDLVEEIYEIDLK